jgi:hypothetical protein
MALLPNGKVLVAGGFGTEALNSAELFNPATGTFSNVAAAMLAHRQGPSAVTLPDGRVYIAGGFGAGATAEYFDPQTGGFSPAPSMLTERFDAAAALLPDGRVLIAGGNYYTTNYSSAEIFDPATGTYTPTGSMSVAKTEMVTAPLQDGRVLVAGGFVAGPETMLSSAEIYDPKTGAFSPTTSLAIPRADSAGTVLADGRVLIAGGRGPVQTAEIFSPGAEITSGGRDFGAHPVGSSNAAGVSVVNNGAQTVKISTTAVNGTAASSFQVVSDGCAGRALKGGQSCQVSVRFAPAAKGALSAGLLVVADPTGPQSFPLRGTGTAPPDTKLKKHPAKTVKARGRKARVKFKFGSPLVGATFRCKLDRKPFKACRSPKSYKVRVGSHVFKVAAVSEGVTDPTPAVFRFKVKSGG